MRKRKLDVVDDSKYEKPSWARPTEWYRLAQSERKYRNPHADKHGILHPARFVIVGQSGAGKTQTVLDTLRVMDNIDEIYVLTIFGSEDPLYALLKRMFAGKCVITSEINDIPEVADLPVNDDVQRAFIFDDVLTLPASVQRRISTYFTAARKCNGTCMYITQSFFQCPKVVRNNCGYIMLLRKLGEANRQDFQQIAARFGDAGVIRDLYDKCQAMEGGPELFWIDCLGPEIQRYRCGFDRVLAPADTE